MSIVYLGAHAWPHHPEATGDAAPSPLPYPSRSNQPGARLEAKFQWSSCLQPHRTDTANPASFAGAGDLNPRPDAG